MCMRPTNLTGMRDALLVTSAKVHYLSPAFFIEENFIAKKITAGKINSWFGSTKLFGIRISRIC